MKVLLLAVVAFSMSLPSTATADYGRYHRQADFQASRERGILISSSRLKRKDGPLREENISDEEVREIQAIMVEEFPGAIVNIGGVTTDCPCEDGPTCDSRVWVVAHRDATSSGLMLSRIGAEWQIGPLQDWWLRRNHLSLRMNASLAGERAEESEQFHELQARLNDLYDDFPVCPNGENALDWYR